MTMQATHNYEVERRTRILGSDVRAGAAYEFSKATGASERGPTPLPPGRGKCLFKGIRSLELKRSQTAPSRRGHKGKVGARDVQDVRHQQVEPVSQLRLVTMPSVEPLSQLRELLHRMKSFGRAHTKTPRASAKKNGSVLVSWR